MAPQARAKHAKPHPGSLVADCTSEEQILQRPRRPAAPRLPPAFLPVVLRVAPRARLVKRDPFSVEIMAEMASQGRVGPIGRLRRSRPARSRGGGRWKGGRAGCGDATQE